MYNNSTHASDCFEVYCNLTVLCIFQVSDSVH